MRFFDLHCDTVLKCASRRQALYDNQLALSVTKAAVLDASVHCLALWVPDGLPPEEASRRVWALADEYDRQLAACDPLWEPAERPFDGRPGRHATLLTVENGAALGDDIAALARLRQRGAVMLTLTWNGANALAGGCENDGGLTSFGREVVRECERLGVLVDVSHLSDAGFYDVAGAATRPLVASHVATRAVCRHPRNLTDHQLRLVAESGGLIGLTLIDSFLRPGGGATLDDLWRHLDHLLSLGLEEHIAVGTDYDGGRVLAPLSTADRLPDWQRDLVSRGLPAAVCDKIFFGNAASFFERWAPHDPRRIPQ